MRELWRSFSRLPQPQRRIALESLAAAFLSILTLRALGFHRTRRLLCAPRNSARQADAAAVSTYSTLLDAVIRRAFPRSKCLVRSLALTWLLRRNGIDGTLVIGVRKQESRLEAHAWVEHEGRVVNDTADVRQRFSALDLPPAAGLNWT